MALLQPKLSLKVAQRQILTPGLMQMVSVLALNKLELKELINTEIVENPVLEELEESVPLIDDIALREAERDRSVEEVAAQAERDKRDPFDEIDFGSYFQDYLDPGFRTPNGFEQTDKPSFENFLSQPSTLTDHLFWQLGSLNLSSDLRSAAEYVVGNLDEDGYLLAEDEELLAGFVREYEPAPGAAANAASELLAEAVHLVQNLDPVGVATRSLRECLLVQAHHFTTEGDGKDNPDAELLPLIISKHLKNVEAKRYLCATDPEYMKLLSPGSSRSNGPRRRAISS